MALGTRTEPTLLWVCTDCYFASQGLNDEHDDTTPDREPLQLVPDDAKLTAGMLREEHEDGCDEDEECSCEQISFTWSSCDGCSSTLGGSREALTMWTEA